jgi:4-hydroxy-tetrahydrodipicolinate synthase
MAAPNSMIQGIIANLPTPFQADGQVDTGRLAELVDFVFESGVHGVSCLLSSGLFPYLSADERVRCIDTVVRQSKGRGPVLAGVSGQTSDESTAHAQRALEMGADALLLMPLSYWRLRDVEIKAHYRKVLGSVDAVWGIYNAPQTTGIDLSPAMYAEIAGAGNLAFTKDASSDILRALSVREACGPEFSYLCGLVSNLLPTLLMGGQGACLALASVAPAECRRLYDLVIGGELDQAREMYRRFLPLFAFFQQHSMFRSVRLASELLGRPLGALRPPLQDLQGEEIRQELARLLTQCELLPSA